MIVTPSGRVPETNSEKLFDAYLESHGYHGWLFEPNIDARAKHPDVLLPYDDRWFAFEVKERHRRASEPGFQWIDPMKGIREEIAGARRKFEEFKDFPCSLVVHNAEDIDTLLEPMWVFGAMLGDPGLSLPMDVANGSLLAQGARNVFSPQRGKMVRSKTGQPQNTTINAIIILEECVPDRQFGRARDEAIATAQLSSARELSEVDRCTIAARLYMEPPRQKRSIVRVRVCENPQARIPLPHSMFRGAYDERWRLVRGEETRIWFGDGIHELQPQ